METQANRSLYRRSCRLREWAEVRPFKRCGIVSACAFSSFHRAGHGPSKLCCVGADVAETQIGFVQGAA